MSILHLLRADGYLTVNKYLAKLLGLHESIILSELIFRYNQHVHNLDKEGMFFCTVETIEENTTLSKYQQSKAIGTLEGNGLIETKTKGLPARRYFKINEEAIAELFAYKESKKLTTDKINCSEPQNAEKERGYQKLKKLTTGEQETVQQEVKKLDSNKEDLINKELLKKNDDDSRSESISLIFEQFKTEISKERFEKVVERVSSIRTNDFVACLVKSVQNEIANSQVLAAKEDNRGTATRNERKNKTTKPKIEIVSPSPTKAVTQEELEELLKLAQKIDTNNNVRVEELNDERLF